MNITSRSTKKPNKSPSLPLSLPREVNSLTLLPTLGDSQSLLLDITSNNLLMAFRPVTTKEFLIETWNLKICSSIQIMISRLEILDLLLSEISKTKTVSSPHYLAQQVIWLLKSTSSKNTRVPKLISLQLESFCLWWSLDIHHLLQLLQETHIIRPWLLDKNRSSGTLTAEESQMVKSSSALISNSLWRAFLNSTQTQDWPWVKSLLTHGWTESAQLKVRSTVSLLQEIWKTIKSNNKKEKLKNASKSLLLQAVNLRSRDQRGVKTLNLALQRKPLNNTWKTSRAALKSCLTWAQMQLNKASLTS